MDFITKLPRTDKGFDAIWIIVDRLIKGAPFLAIWESSSSDKLADMYVRYIFDPHDFWYTLDPQKCIMIWDLVIGGRAWRGDNLVCGEVFDLLDGQGRAPDTTQKATTFGGSHVEMGTNHYGFYHQVTQDG